MPGQIKDLAFLNRGHREETPNATGLWRELDSIGPCVKSNVSIHHSSLETEQVNPEFQTNLHWLCKFFFSFAFGKTIPCLVCILNCSVMSNSLWPQWIVAHQSPLSMGFSRQEYWRGLPFPTPRIFLTHWSNLHLLHWQEDSLPLNYLGSPIFSLTIWLILNDLLKSQADSNSKTIAL